MNPDLSDEAVAALAMACDVSAIGEALLDGDLLESRFLTLRLLKDSRGQGRLGVIEAASVLLDVLAPAHGASGLGVGAAFVTLQTAVEALYPADQPGGGDYRP